MRYSPTVAAHDFKNKSALVAEGKKKKEAWCIEAFVKTVSKFVQDTADLLSSRSWGQKVQ